MKESPGLPPDEQPPEFATPVFEPLTPAPVSPPDADLPTWTFNETVTGVTLTLLPWLALAALSLLLSGQSAPSKPLTTPQDITGAILSLIIQTLLEATFLIAPLWYAVFRPRRIARRQGLPAPAPREGLRALGLRTFRPWQATLGVALGVLGIYVASVLYGLIAQALHIDIQTNVDALLKQAQNEPWTILATLLVAIIVAPFCEEIFFRGLLFQGMRLRLSVWAAIVLSALLFGIAHGDPGSLPLLVVIGLMLAALRWRTRSLWPGMLLHMLNNALAALVVLQALHFH